MDQNANPVYAGLENIKRVVVLMFENRSFDHLFGDFKNVNGLFDKDGKFKEECYNLHNPLVEPCEENNPKYFPTPVDPFKPMAGDFTHDFADGMMPDLFGPIFTVTGDPPFPCNYNATYTAGYAQGQLWGAMQPAPPTYPRTNSGFMTTYNFGQQQGPAALNYFKNGELKVLHKLANEFVLCDNWHCDMPGHTKPNRAFIHCGTTCGPTGTTEGIDDTDGGMVNATSIFDLINDGQYLNPKPTWQMYAAGTVGNLANLDTRFISEALKKDTKGLPFTQFSEDCKNGALPFYSFLMCWLDNSDGFTDSSMHPNSMIQGGENLLAAVYNTLRKSPCWEDTLLVITFDENGGLYDHVFPPHTTPPNPGQPPVTQTSQGDCGNHWLQTGTFDFSLLGLRVPALLISPWLSKGVDSNLYQNTSVLRFLIDKMNALYKTNAQYLTQRDANAPVLDSVFRDFGRKDKRMDCPLWIEPYTSLPFADPATCSTALPYSDGLLTLWNPAAGTDMAAPVRYINELLNIYIRPLPGHPDSGNKITRNFTTNAEVAQYKKERQQAADLYYQSKK